VGSNVHPVLFVLLQAISLAEFLQPMLAWDPQQRPTAAELLQHPYFKPLLEETPEQQQQQQLQQQEPNAEEDK
jgi:serine/threonine protein kinase